MTSHALTPEQTEALSVQAVRTIGSILGSCDDCCTEATQGDMCARCYKVFDGLMEFGRDLAEWLLEPVEKERDEWKALLRTMTMRADENLAMCSAAKMEIYKLRALFSEAREENTRLREQLDECRANAQGFGR